MKLNTISLAAAALLFVAGNHSFAGSLTPGSGTQPSFSPTNVISANTIALQQTSPSVLSILGNATITPGAGASMVTLTLTGTFTANAGDLASYFYNFNIALNSATPATFTLSLSASSLSTSTGAQTIAANSNQSYTGHNQTVAAPFGATGSFTGQLKINFAAGTTASDNLVLSIPAGSIDFAVQPVAIPEPSTYALLGAGLLGMLVLMRRRSVTDAA
jgi:PEP-CTERM motif